MVMVLGLTMEDPSHSCRRSLRPDTLQLPMVALVLALLLWSAAAEVETPPMGLPGCSTTCGNTTVPYPFGISPSCFLPGFNLTCDRTHDPPRLHFGSSGTTKLQVTAIYLNNATVRLVSSGAIINEPFFPTVSGVRGSWALPGDGTFVLSYENNRFVVVGCDAEAKLYPVQGGNAIASCSPSCSLDDPRHWVPTKGGGCNECAGNGCYQANISRFSPSYMVSYRPIRGPTHLLRFVVLIAEQGWIERVWCRMGGLSWPYRKLPLPDLSAVPVVLEWAMNSTEPVYPGISPDYTSRCPTNMASSACKSSNSRCVDMNSVVRSGYACQCLVGYHGNPYLIDGCRDIDECKDPDNYPCFGECTNLPGTHQCRCPRGSHGNPSLIDGCIKSSNGLSIGLGVGSGALLLILALGAIFLVHKLVAQRKKRTRQRFFKQNRGRLLQQLVGQRADIGERMIITLQELEKATNNFDKSCELGGGAHGTVYKGILSSQHVVAIKKSKIVVQKETDDFINEVAILSQINHRNVVKLIGCCLETEVPLLVYEFIPNGTLYSHLHIRGPISLSWKDRLRIAVETARALTYLHSFVSTPIIHRDIKSPNILLDDNLTVKLSDFGASRCIPIDQEGVDTAVQGTLGYLDPMYHTTGQLNEKSDVYSFGVLLIELLTRKKPVSYRSSQGFALANHFVTLVSEHNLVEILDPQVTREGDGEVIDVSLLAAICVKVRGEERPTMRQVEMTLESIQAAKDFSSDVADDDISSEGTYTTT
ncbi:unnamed protein product [Urochloa decumbens]|uniref:Protein kinase domain-containing protein n=1 Tax=Urochloa decumbens TaxID=240449 RepID=A0ABC9HAH4_9POAL